MNFVKLLVLLLGMSTAAWAFADNQAPGQSCMAGKCRPVNPSADGRSGYGPGGIYFVFETGFYQTPFLNTDSSLFNRALNYYRNPGASPEAGKFYLDFQKSLSEAAGNHKPDASISRENYQYALGMVNAFMHGAVSGIPVYAAETPVPHGVQKEELDSLMSGLRAAESSANPIAASVEFSRINTEILERRSINGGLNDKVSDYLERELYRKYLDSQGLFSGLVHAKKIDFSLKTGIHSGQGVAIRNSLNGILAAEEMAGFLCASAPGNESVQAGCRRFSDSVGQLKLVYKIADEFAYRDAHGPYGEVMSGLVSAERYLKGFVQGLYNGGRDIVETAALLAGADLTQVMFSAFDGIYKAVVNYPETAARIRDFIKDKVNDLITGSPEARGEMLGRLTFDIATFVLPVYGTKAVSIFKVPVSRAALGFSVESIAGSSAAAGQIGRLEAAGLGNLARLHPEMARDIAISLVKSKQVPAELVSEAGRKFLREFSENSFDLDTALVKAVKANNGDLFGRSKVGKVYNHHLDYGKGSLPEVGESEKITKEYLDTIGSFSGKTYWEVTPTSGEVLYRFGGAEGRFWIRNKIFSYKQAMNENAILPIWNDFKQISILRVPDEGIGRVFEGITGHQAGPHIINGVEYSASTYFSGGKGQVFIPRGKILELVQKGLIKTKNVD